VTLTQEQIKEFLSYDPLTGIFKWAVNRRRIKHGTIAGSVNSRGYVRISLFDKSYFAHRLAWLYMTGEWASMIDHKNGNKSDNKWSNLRLANPAINAQNVRAATSRSRIGVLGVSPPARGKTRFKAAIQISGKSVHLGYHDTADKAHAAYVAAKRQLHEGATL